MLHVTILYVLYKESKSKQDVSEKSKKKNKKKQEKTCCTVQSCIKIIFKNQKDGENKYYKKFWALLKY